MPSPVNGRQIAAGKVAGNHVYNHPQTENHRNNDSPECKKIQNTALLARHKFTIRKAKLTSVTIG